MWIILDVFHSAFILFLKIVRRALDQSISKWLTETVLSMLERELDSTVPEELQKRLEGTARAIAKQENDVKMPKDKLCDNKQFFLRPDFFFECSCSWTSSEPHPTTFTRQPRSD